MTSRPRPLAALAALLLAGLAACSSGPSREQKKQLVSLHTEMALGYYQLGDLQRAEGQALKGLELAPGNDMLELVLAWTLQRRGSTNDVLRAEAIFRKLEQSGDYRATVGLGEALEQKGKAYDEAARRIRSGEQETSAPDPAKRADELEADAHKAWDESVGRYEKTLEQHPGDRDALNGLQRVLALLGRYPESLARSQELVDQITSEVDFWQQRLERPEITAQDELRLRDLVQKARELQLASYLQQALVLRVLGRQEEELERLTAALELDPTRPDVYGRRAQVLKELGRYQDAIQDIDEFLKLTPEPFDHPDTRQAYELRAACQAEIEKSP
jgi:tetratricopeptide (TPR) repeat protein